MSPQRFRQLADPLPEAMLLVTSGGEIRGANRAAATRFGMAAADLAGRRLDELLSQSADSVTRYLRTCARSRQLVPGRLRIAGNGNGSTGSELAVRGAVVEPRNNGDEALVVLRLEVQDASRSRFLLLSRKVDDLNQEVGRRSRAEDELRGQRALLEVTLSSIGDGVITTDSESRITFMNPVAEELTGWRLEDAAGRELGAIYRLLDERDRTPATLPISETLERGVRSGLVDHTLLVQRDDGEVAVETGIAPIKREDGEIVGAVLSFRDVEERRQVERRRAEILARERTARAKAEAADQAKDEFMATISHELRTPLNAILSWIYLLKSQKLDDAARQQALETVERNAEHQARLVEELLQLSELAGELVELEIGAVDADRLVAEVVRRHAGEAEAAGIEVILESAQSMPLLKADARRLAEGIEVLLVNALEFTPAGGEIRIELGREGGQGWIAVRDNGEGFGAEALPRLFERFRQADGSHSRVHGGLGLGLTKARQLIELQGGTLEAQSPGPGLGSTFTVRLPLA